MCVGCISSHAIDFKLDIMVPFSLECVTELKGDRGGMEQFKTRLMYTFAYIRRRSQQGIPIGLSFNERLR